MVFNAFKICDWSVFYPDTEEVIPHDAPMEHGDGAITSCFVVPDHAGCKEATRHLHTSVIILVNNTPILWYHLKHQPEHSS